MVWIVVIIMIMVTRSIRRFVPLKCLATSKFSSFSKFPQHTGSLLFLLFSLSSSPLFVLELSVLWSSLFVLSCLDLSVYMSISRDYKRLEAREPNTCLVMPGHWAVFLFLQLLTLPRNLLSPATWKSATWPSIAWYFSNHLPVSCHDCFVNLNRVNEQLRTGPPNDPRWRHSTAGCAASW